MVLFRRITGLLITLLLTFYLVDFSGFLFQPLHALGHIQVIPALLSGLFGIVFVVLLLTWLFGRIYCSTICPLGVSQDFVGRLRKKRKRKYRYRKPSNVLRYLMLVIALLSLGSGVSTVLMLFDPYSIFSRAVVELIRPIYLLLNNVAAAGLSAFGNYFLYNIEIFSYGQTALVVSFVLFGAILGVSFFYGRLYCNTICPVGSLLGLVSNYSLFGVRMDKDGCNSCGKCERSCKSMCIDAKSKSVDLSRCVACFNCVDSCNKGAIKYCKSKPKLTQRSEGIEPDGSKRAFLFSVVGVAAVVPSLFVRRAIGGFNWQEVKGDRVPLSPPGSRTHALLNKQCTGCQMCVAKCPSKVLKSANLEYGLVGIANPRMDFRDGFCNYDCTVCSEVCPNGALQIINKQEKHHLQMGFVVFVKENCIVSKNENDCGACSEHCPTQAVRMVPYGDNGLTIPEVDTSICVGCGGCEYICPASAIYVQGLVQHGRAEAFEHAEKHDTVIDDFGF